MVSPIDKKFWNCGVLFYLFLTISITLASRVYSRIKNIFYFISHQPAIIKKPKIKIYGNMTQYIDGEMHQFLTLFTLLCFIWGCRYRGGWGEFVIILWIKIWCIWYHSKLSGLVLIKKKLNNYQPRVFISRSYQPWHKMNHIIFPPLLFSFAFLWFVLGFKYFSERGVTKGDS